LNSINKLDELEAYEQKKYKEEIKQEIQLPVFISKALAPANSPSVYSVVDFSNPFDNPDFVALLANYNFLDPFWSDQGIGFGTPQTS
jgi:hypothetical protein